MNEKPDFDAFVDAVREVSLDDELVHEAAHSTAVSVRTWRKADEEQDGS